MCACVDVCVRACVHVCVCLCLYVCVHACMHLCACVCVCGVCVCVCMGVCVCACACVPMCSECVHACMCAYMTIVISLSVHACLCVRLHDWENGQHEGQKASVCNFLSRVYSLVFTAHLVPAPVSALHSCKEKCTWAFKMTIITTNANCLSHLDGSISGEAKGHKRGDQVFIGCKQGWSPFSPALSFHILEICNKVRKRLKKKKKVR